MLEINLRFLYIFSMKIFKASLFLIIFYQQDCLAAQANSPENSIREYKAVYITEKLKIDGSLNERAWQAAPFTEDFVINENSSVTKLKTSAQIVWDDSSLYIAFRINDNDIWSTMKKHDDPLWKQETVEIFIDPDGDGCNYIELQINAVGTTFDLVIDRPYNMGGRGNPDWTLEGLKPGIKIDGTINKNDTDKSWTCELAIPFHSIAAQLKYFSPKPGDIWRINLCRIERDRLNKSLIEISAWNPTYSGSFHIPEKFGKLIFKDKIAQ